MMLPHGYRHERLADQIREEVAEMIAGELKDPRIGFATVTHVDLSPDLRHGRVRVSVLGDEESRRETLEGLSSAAGYVRYEISRRLRLRRAPELVFVLDQGAEEGQKIETLLQKLKEEH
jgi:ribosome-binding factor A